MLQSELFLSSENQSLSIYWYTPGYHWDVHSTLALRSPVGFGSSYPHILGTFMYLSQLLALPTGVSWGHLQNKSMSQRQLLGEPKLRHDWTLLCRFIKTSPWPLYYLCISKASTYPFAKKWQELWDFSQRSLSSSPCLEEHSTVTTVGPALFFFMVLITTLHNSWCLFFH